MVARLGYEVEPGGLTEEHHERIHEMAGRDIKPAVIARLLKKHPSTVQWYMLTEGLITRQRATAQFTPYMRGGRMIRPYCPEEDAFIEAHRVQGLTLAKIAELANERFGNERNAHGIHVRLVLLAATEAA